MTFFPEIDAENTKRNAKRKLKEYEGNMEWSDWVMYQPQTKSDIITKIENDGYTYPHYDKSKNGVKFVMCLESIKNDCQAVGFRLSEVYPLQTKLF